MEDEKKSNLDNFVYHYCSLDSFFKIIKSGKIRFSEVTKSNDCQELEYIRKLFFQYVSQKHITPVSSYRKFSDIFLDKRYFAFCTSRNCNNALQWLNYANPGVVICFDKKSLMNDFQKNEQYGIKIIDDDVKYADINCLNGLDLFFDGIIKIQKNGGTKKYEVIEKIADKFSKLSILFKNSIWCSENEHRFYFLKSIKNIDTKKLLDKAKIDCDVELLNNSFVWHFDMPFSVDSISKIILSNNSISKKDVKALIKFKAGVNFRDSQIEPPSRMRGR